MAYPTKFQVEREMGEWTIRARDDEGFWIVVWSFWREGRARRLCEGLQKAYERGFDDGVKARAS